MKPQPTFYRFIRYTFLTLIMLQGVIHSFAQGQLPECTADVPFFVMDLSSDPDSTYTTPEIVRKAGCCGDNDNYVSFYVTLHPEVAMFELIVAPGYADPGGSGNYTIISGGDLINPGSCGVPVPGGSPICITGTGPHKIVYSKPGSNKIKYIFRQIPKPIFPQDQPTRFGCSLNLPIYGLNAIQINAIAKSANLTASFSACDSMLSCLNCPSPSFEAISNVTYPYTVTYEVTGSPIAEYCGEYPSSDTFTITVYSPLDISFSPDPVRFCEGADGVEITANGNGGFGAYEYLWLNSSGDTLGFQSSFFADSAQNYTLVLADDLVSSTCLPEYQTIPVIMDSPPTISAGNDTIICATEPMLYLSGFSSTGSGVWSGGNGVFSPSDTTLVTNYQPTAQEIYNGVDLVLTSTGTGAGCIEASDTIHFSFSDSIQITFSADPIACYNGQTAVNTTVEGGIQPLNYLWSSGNSGTSIYSGAGTVELFISDSIGCSANSSLFLNQPDPLYVSISSVLDSGSCSGSANSSVIGGSIPYSYLWSSGSTLASASNLCAGIDTLIVTDNNGCQFLQSFVINHPTCENFNVGIDTVIVNPCYGDSLGSITAFSTGGSGSITYTWNTLPISYGPTLLNLAAGTYSVLAEDSLGCLDIVSAVVLQPTPITSAIYHTDVTVIGGSDGTATVNPIGGSPAYTFVWSPGSQTTQTATNLIGSNGGQVYQVMITDENECIKIDSVIINEPPCNDFFLGISTQSVSCFGGSNGSASLAIADGHPPFTITWSTGETGVSTIDSLASGNYVVSVSDSSNCTTFKHFTITQPSELSLAITPTQITCNGSADGSIDLTVFGGTYPYTYSWYNNSSLYANHEDLYLLSTGDYVVHVTDRFGCSDSASIAISQPDQIQATYDYTDNPCYGNILGTIDLHITGGVQPYGYTWTGPAGFASNNPTLNQLKSGLYSATVTDLNNCSLGSIEVYINQPDSLQTLASIVQQVECLGWSDGAIQATTIGGTIPYSLAWYSNSTLIGGDQVLDSVPAGEYIVISTDSLGCVAQDTLTLTTVLDSIPPVINCAGNQTVETQSTTCTYLQSSTAWNATASDNCTVSKLSYVLTGTTTGTGTSLQNVAFQPGNTTVTWTAIDSIGNTSSCSFIVTVVDSTAPSVISCALSGNQQVSTSAGSCFYQHAGIAWNPTATDNCSPVSMTYSLSGATTGTGSSLNGVQFMPGTTNVNWTISDTAGNSSYCNYSITITDTEYPLISCIANQTVQTQSTTCSYLQSSTAWNAAASDNCNVSSLSYVLTGATTGTGTSLQNVAFQPGTTTVTWTAIDSIGNTSSCSFIVTLADSTAPSVISCAISGNQQVSTSSGSCYYQHAGIAWNPEAIDNCSPVSMTYSLSGATTGTGSSLNGVQFMPGTTNVNWTISDTAGNSSYCNYSITVTDTEYPLISCIANQTVQTQSTTCSYLQSSTAWNATASDNCTVSSLSYVLTGATTGTGTSLQNVAFQPGTTTVTWTAIDSIGNTSSCSFIVTVVDSTAPSVISCALSGNQQVSTSAGSCYYQHAGTAWNPTAIDNCSPVSMTYSLSGATTGTGSSLNGVQFMPGTTNVNWTISDTAGNSSYCSYSITVTDTEPPLITGCPQNITASSEPTVCGAWVSWNSPFATDNCSVTMNESLASGTYLPVGLHTITYVAIDGAFNSTTCSFNVNVIDATPPVVVCPAAIHSCQPMVSFGLPNALDNCAIQSITQTQGLTSESMFPIGETINAYLIADIHGNTTTCSFSVQIHTLPQITLDVDNINCHGANDGAIDATITNAVPPFDFYWSNQQIVEDLEQLSAGNYTLNVTDSYGCQSSLTTIVSEPEALVLSGISDSVSCYGSADGGFDLSVQGGTNPYFYSWSDDSNIEDLNNVPSGSYSVIVSDGNGCLAQLSTVILSPTAISIVSSITSATCTSSTGAIAIDVTGGSLPYQYEWSNGTTESDLVNVPSGLYTLTVTDGNGCSLENTMLIETTSNIEAELIIKQALCAGIADGSVNVSVLEGNPPYTYDWSNGQTNSSINNLYEGQFSVTITDSYGCKDTLYTELIAPDTFYVELNPSVYPAGTNISTYGNDDGFILTEVVGGNSTYTYEWSTGSILSALYNLNAGMYTVNVTDDNGCVASASVTLTEPNALALPTGYSPNGDNDNDFFVVRGIEAYPDNDIVVFNRWGNVVYRQNDYANEWSGANTNGEELPDGTYFVLLNAYGEETITLKGYVDLRR